MDFLSLTQLIYGQSIISVTWSYCLHGHFSLDKTVDHISDTRCTYMSMAFSSMKGLLFPLALHGVVHIGIIIPPNC